MEARHASLGRKTLEEIRQKRAAEKLQKASSGSDTESLNIHGVNKLDVGSRISEKDRYELLSRVKELENKNVELENQNRILSSRLEEKEADNDTLFKRLNEIENSSLPSLRKALNDASIEKAAAVVAKEDALSQLRTIKKRLKEAEEDQYRAEEDAAALRAELNSIQQQNLGNPFSSMPSTSNSEEQIHAMEKEIMDLTSKLQQESILRHQEQNKLKEEQIRASMLLAEKQEVEDKLVALSAKITEEASDAAARKTFTLQDKEVLEGQLHDMALMVERLEAGRQKLLMEIDSQSSEIERLFEENSNISSSYHDALGVAVQWENQVKECLKQNEELRGLLDKLRSDQVNSRRSSASNAQLHLEDAQNASSSTDIATENLLLKISEDDCSIENGNDVESDNNNDEVDLSSFDYPDLTSQFTTDKLFESKESVRQWCMDRGVRVNCIVVTKRTRMRNLLNNGKGSWMVLVCERSGEYVEKKAKNHVPKTQQKRRRSGSRKCGCPFELSARCRDDGRWILEVKNGCHNHKLPNVLTGHPYVARLQDHEVKTVETMTNSGVRPRNILTAIRIDNPESHSTIRNIYNAKAKLKLQNTEGRTVMQQFMKLASTHHYSVYHRVDDATNEVSDLFFSHPRCVVLAQCFHQILFLDCTFKTNRYKLPCFHMVSQTSTGSPFTVALAFISRKTTESYIWALQCVRKCCRDKEIPSVIITDAEIALTNAVATVFPAARHILCAWHISKNVQANCKPNFIKKKRVLIGDKEVVLEDEEGKMEYELFWNDWTNVHLP